MYIQHLCLASDSSAAIRREFRAHHFYNRPTWDIKRHASGHEDEDRYIEPAMDLPVPERAWLAETLYNQPDDSNPSELLELRIQAAELMIAVCGKTEIVKRHRTRRKAIGNILVKDFRKSLLGCTERNARAASGTIDYRSTCRDA